MRLQPLLTADETRRAEEAHQGSMEELMERAGTAVAEHVLRQFPGRVTVVCGHGNNGGDGKVCARVLREAGREVTLVEGVGDLGDPDVIVDALLGIGLTDAPREDAARMIELINASERPVVAVDVPSGVNASTGEVPGVAVHAASTVTFGAAKVGLAIAPGRFHAGQVQIAPIGLRPHEHEHALVPASALLEVPRKQTQSTKYTAGSVLVVGGSRGLTGAPMLTALAAFRADAGYVAVAAPESTLPILEATLLEVVKRPLPEDSSGRLLPRSSDAILAAAEKADAVAIGPGLGRSDGTVELVRILLEQLDLPVVLDADALWELEPFARSAPTVLTPHSGELARLLGIESRRDRGTQARRRAASCVSVRRGRAAQGRRHDRRVTARGCARRVVRHARACDCRLGRRAHGNRRCLPRQGNGCAARSRHRGGRARRRGGTGRPAAGLDRVRPAAGAPARARRPRPSARAAAVRSEVTIDLGALRRNVKTLLRAVEGAEVWAVVKADAYGHGAVDCAGAALGAGAQALCVATVGEALDLRAEFSEARILVLGPGFEPGGRPGAGREAGAGRCERRDPRRRSPCT